MSEREVVVIGAGGHAKVVVSTLQAAGVRIAAAYDDDRSKWGSEILGVTVRGPISSLDPDRLPTGILALGSNAARRRLAASLPLSWAVAVHPHAYVHPSVRLGEGTVVFAGAILQPGTVVGCHAIINTGATADHDCRIGDFAHLAPGTHLAGNVRIGEGCLLGVGSSVIPGLSIGDWAVLGAGGVVVRDIEAGSTAFGVPARPAEPR